MKDITSYVYNFEELIRGNFLYVDKTEYIWQLIRPSSAGYFLSRPRRFGKSLTLSTLKAVFEGKKELFKGLAIYDKPYDWKPYPVVHLNFGNCDAQTPEELRSYLASVLKEAAKNRYENILADIQPDNLAVSFEILLNAASRQGNVVVLIDEYDKPILNTLSLPESQDCLKVLKGFYSTVKKCESILRFAFITGVSKFSHVSLFSDLNNLTDITMEKQQRCFALLHAPGIAKTIPRQRKGQHHLTSLSSSRSALCIHFS